MRSDIRKNDTASRDWIVQITAQQLHGYLIFCFLREHFLSKCENSSVSVHPVLSWRLKISNCRWQPMFGIGQHALARS
jgi:hypothetical protein